MPEESLPVCAYCGLGCSIYGLCHCGCGQPTKLAVQTLNSVKQRRGKPLKFLYGHARRGPSLPPSYLCICRSPNCEIPYGICHCGCGQRTEIWQKTDTHVGAIKGRPHKYILGHTLKRNRIQGDLTKIANRSQRTIPERNTRDKTYSSWAAMKARCLNPNNPGYYYYGGRGIKVHERWMCFENFLSDMGEKPDRSFSIERIDVNGNYEPDNCKWATAKEQYANRRTRSKGPPRMPPWIDVRHGCPIPCEMVLAYHDNLVSAAYFVEGAPPSWIVFSLDGSRVAEVSHWMPFPNGPELVEVR